MDGEQSRTSATCFNLAVDGDGRARTSRESQVDGGTYAAAAKWRGQQSTCYRARRAERVARSGRSRRLGGEDSGRGKLRRRYVIRRTIGPNALDAEPIKRGEASSLLVDDVTRDAATIEDAGSSHTRIRETILSLSSERDPIGFYGSLTVLQGGSFNVIDDMPRYTAIKSYTTGWAFNRAKTKKFQGNIKKLIV